MGYLVPLGTVSKLTGTTSTVPAGAQTMAGLDGFRTALFQMVPTVIPIGGTSVQIGVQGSGDGIAWVTLLNFDVVVPGDSLTGVWLGWLSESATPGAIPAKAATLAVKTAYLGPWGNHLRVIESCIGTHTTAMTYSVGVSLKR